MPLKVVRLMERHAAVPRVLAALLPFLDTRYQKKPMLVHLDVTSAVSAWTPWLVGGWGDWVSVACWSPTSGCRCRLAQRNFSSNSSSCAACRMPAGRCGCGNHGTCMWWKSWRAPRPRQPGVRRRYESQSSWRACACRPWVGLTLALATRNPEEGAVCGVMPRNAASQYAELVGWLSLVWGPTQWCSVCCVIPFTEPLEQPSSVVRKVHLRQNAVGISSSVSLSAGVSERVSGPEPAWPKRGILYEETPFFCAD